MVITEIIYEKNILSNNFTFDNYQSNIKTMKCVSTLFSKSGLLSNISSYILIFNLIMYLILFILYFKIGLFLIDKDIEKIIKEKEKTNNENQENSSKVKLKEKKKKKLKNIEIGNNKSNPSKKKK